MPAFTVQEWKAQYQTVHAAYLKAFCAQEELRCLQLAEDLVLLTQGTPLEATYRRLVARHAHLRPACDHHFQGALCTQCLCPETPEEDQRASKALAMYADLKNWFSLVLGRYLTKDEARHAAWRAHRKS